MCVVCVCVGFHHGGVTFHLAQLDLKPSYTTTETFLVFACVWSLHSGFYMLTLFRQSTAQFHLFSEEILKISIILNFLKIAENSSTQRKSVHPEHLAQH